MIYSDMLPPFVRNWEDMRLVSYDDGLGVWTIGCGHTRGVKRGQTCDEAQAMRWLRSDLVETESQLQRYLKRKSVQRQYDALVSIAFNCGPNAIGGSGLLEQFNLGNDQACADRFLMWNKGRKDGKLTALPGLSRRRAAEREIYLHGDYSGRP